MADFAFYEGLAKAPPEIAAAVREAWPDREPLWLAVTGPGLLLGKGLIRHCAVTFAALAEYDSEPLGGGRTLHAGLLREKTLAVPIRRPVKPPDKSSAACEPKPQLAVA